MSFWSWLTGAPNHAGITANANPGSSVSEPDWNPGDPDGVEITGGEGLEARSLPAIAASPWSGWPAEWSTPNWSNQGLTKLVDTAWACLDLNSSVLSTMPVYRTRSGRIIEPTSWMGNPDPMIYSSWFEFAKQLFWDYQLGEAFVLPMARFADGLPMTFRVIPPWMVDVEMKNGSRRYRLGGSTGPDVSDEILHIRYKSTTDSARGIGPLDAAGARMTAAGVLARYASEIAANGGVPYLTLETDQQLDDVEAQDLLNQWVASRSANVGRPAVLDNGIKAVPHQVSPKDMALLEVSQFTESRIAIMLGVPPFLVGLPSGGDSMTYSNVSSLFDFHDRSSLRPKAAHVMAALSYWALPHGQAVELNRDEYTRPSFEQRAAAWVALKNAGIVGVDEVRAAERLQGEAPAPLEPVVPATVALTGGEQ